VNYTQLKSAVADFLNRQDLSSVIPTFVTFCEADINRKLRHRKMLARATAVLDEQYTALPTDFLEAKNIQLNTDIPVSLKYVTLEHADLLRSGTYSSTGEPKYYTILGSSLETVPTPDTEYTIELAYYQAFTTLDEEENTTNWLLTSHPDVYVYGTLVHSAPYLKDDERIPVWVGLYEKALSDLKTESDTAEFSGSSLVTRARWP
jgi:hypothetical protein